MRLENRERKTVIKRNKIPLKNELYLCPYCGVDLMKPEVDIEWHKVQKCAPKSQFEELANKNPNVSDRMKLDIQILLNERLITLQYHYVPCCYEVHDQVFPWS